MAALMLISSGFGVLSALRLTPRSGRKMRKACFWKLLPGWRLPEAQTKQGGGCWGGGGGGSGHASADRSCAAAGPNGRKTGWRIEHVVDKEHNLKLISPPDTGLLWHKSQHIAN